jgi:hypothetical protein
MTEAQAVESLLRRLMQSGLPTKAAAKEVSRLIPGVSRKQAYALALQMEVAKSKPGS